MKFDDYIKIIFGVVTGIIALGGTVVAVAKYFSNRNRDLQDLAAKVSDLTKQLDAKSQILELAESSGASADVYTKILKSSTEAATAIGTDFHSISIPATHNADVTHLRIILSTDPEAEKVVGREFAITSSIAGYVFEKKSAYIKKKGVTDQRHQPQIDKAAGTKTGTAAMLVAPLVEGGRCYGVIQLMRLAGPDFREEDIAILQRWSPSLARLLADLKDSPGQDIPSVASGKETDASILFSDIHAYSEFAAHVRVATVVDLLNEYYSRLASHALHYDGVIQEYVGDGLYVAFADKGKAASARAAAYAAIAMQQEYHEILNGWIRFGHPVSAANTHSIGVATGKVYRGFMGHPDVRREKIVGPPVNLAAHICKEATQAGGGIYVCSETADTIDPEASLCLAKSKVGQLDNVFRLTLAAPSMRPDLRR